MLQPCNFLVGELHAHAQTRRKIAVSGAISYSHTLIPIPQGQLVLVSDRGVDGEFLVHHFLSQALKGQPTIEWGRRHRSFPLTPQSSTPPLLSSSGCLFSSSLPSSPPCRWPPGVPCLLHPILHPLQQHSCQAGEPSTICGVSICPSVHPFQCMDLLCVSDSHSRE